MSTRAALKRLQQDAEPITRRVWRHDGERMSTVIAAIPQRDLDARLRVDGAHLTPQQLAEADAYLLEHVPNLTRWAEAFTDRWSIAGWGQHATRDDVLSERYRTMNLPEPGSEALSEARALRRQPHITDAPIGVLMCEGVARYWAAVALEMSDGAGSTRPARLGRQP